MTSICIHLDRGGVGSIQIDFRWCVFDGFCYTEPSEREQPHDRQTNIPYGLDTIAM